jgi:hypothetical protein
VSRDLRGDVVAREDVAVQRHHRVVGTRAQHVRDVAQGPRRTEELGLGDVLQTQPPGTAVAEHRLEVLGAVRGREQHPVHAAAGELADLVSQERDAGHRQQVLGMADGQRPQPGAEATGDDDCFQHCRRSCHSRRGQRDGRQTCD